MKRIIALILGLVIAFSLFGCGDKEITGDKHLQISVIDLGYGTQWVEELCKAFQEKKGKEGVEITYKVEPANRDALLAQLLAGGEVTTSDIFMDEYPTHLSLQGQKLSNGEPVAADLTDLYETVVEGTTETIEDRLYLSIKDAYQYKAKYSSDNQRHYYSFPTLNDTNGFYYNKTFFEDNNLKIPRTTDELLELAETIKGMDLVYGIDGQTRKIVKRSEAGNMIKNDFYTFVGYPGYWNYIFQVWWAQYDGLEEYNNFFSPNYDYKPSNSNSYYQKQLDGRRSALQNLYDLVNADSKYYDVGRSSKEFTAIQRDFLVGASAIIPNGGWLDIEMKDTATPYNVEIMKIPVNSAIADKLEIEESELRAIISYVDNGEKTSEKPQGISDNIISEVKKARGLTCTSVAYTYPAIIPAYSDAIDLAKEFLAFTTTDEALKIKFEQAGIMPFTKCDYEKVFHSNGQKWNNFKESKLKVMSAPDYQIVQMAITSDPLYFMNDLNLFNGGKSYPANYFSATGGDHLTVADFLTIEQSYMESKWDNLVIQAREINKAN